MELIDIFRYEYGTGRDKVPDTVCTELPDAVHAKAGPGDKSRKKKRPAGLYKKQKRKNKTTVQPGRPELYASV